MAIPRKMKDGCMYCSFCEDAGKKKEFKKDDKGRQAAVRHLRDKHGKRVDINDLP